MSLNNWVKQFDLECAGPFWISLFGVLFWAGFAIFSFILPPLSDKNGRKSLFLGCVITNFVIFIVLLFLPENKFDTDPWTVYTVLGLYCALGCQAGGLTSIGYNYFMELAPSSYMSMMGTVWNVSEGAIYMYLTIYYAYIAVDWRYTIMFASAFNFVCILI